MINDGFFCPNCNVKVCYCYNEHLMEFRLVTSATGELHDCMNIYGKHREND